LIKANYQHGTEYAHIVGNLAEEPYIDPVYYDPVYYYRRNHMKNNKSLFILFALLVFLLTPIQAFAGEQNRQVAIIGAAVETVAFPEARVGEQHPFFLGRKMGPTELDRVRGKGISNGKIEDTASLTNGGRIILWDENSSSGTRGIQAMSYDSGIGGKQFNRLVFHNQ
jgi:hypothetical protein